MWTFLSHLSNNEFFGVGRVPHCFKTQAERPAGGTAMIRKLSSGEYRLLSRKKDPNTGKRRNLGTFNTREAAEKHERAVQYFKRH
jgi:hypothetical protein